MGRIKNFFNRIFGRQPKALNEAKANYEIPSSLPEKEHKPNLQETLEAQTIKPDKLNLDGVVDMMVEAYGLENICKNARGRDMLTDMVKKTDLDLSEKKGGCSVEHAKCTLERAFGGFKKQGKITLVERDLYNGTNFYDKAVYGGGVRLTTIEADEKGKLVETRRGHLEYEKSKEQTPVLYYENTRTIDESGVEIERTHMNRWSPFERTFMGVSDTIGFGDPELISKEGEGQSEVVRRVDGLYAEVAVRKNGRTVRGESHIVTQNGIDDLCRAGICEKIDRPNLNKMSNYEREQYDKKIKEVIGNSKYKEGLIKMIPGAEDLAKDEVSKDIEE